MKNNRGFSLVEVMATFVLTTVILVMLVELILNLKDIYKQGDLKTTLYINQANIERKIYNDMFDSSSILFTMCGSGCVDITTDNGIKRLEVKDNSIMYDGYSMNIASGSKVGNLSTNVISETLNSKTKNIYKIDIPITNKLVEGDYGLHIVTQG